MNLLLLISAALPVFGLVLVRTTGLLVALPLLAAEVAPIRMRAALAIVVSLALSTAVPTEQPSSLALALVGELLVGVGMGLVLRLALHAAELAGEVLSSQVGFGFDRMMNPASPEGTSPIGQIASVTTAIVVFSTGLHVQVLRGLAQSFTALPAGAVSFSAGWTTFLVSRADAMMDAALALALPLSVVLLTGQLVLGLLSRVAPQLNAWAIGFAASTGLALMGLALFVPRLVATVSVVIEGGTQDALELLSR